jgi:hypothetical protein
MINTTTISISICDVCSASAKTESGYAPENWQKLYLQRKKNPDEFNHQMYSWAEESAFVQLRSFDVCDKCYPKKKKIVELDPKKAERECGIFQKMFARGI